MSKLANISGRRAAKVFCKFGYRIDYQTGSHIILYHPKKPILCIPNHKEIAPGLLKAQIARAGLTVEDFTKAK